MTAPAPFVVHVAAPPVGWVQSCAECGTALLDNTAWSEGRVAVAGGDAMDGPHWWPAGERVATDKTGARTASITYVLGPPGRGLADDERLCAGTN